MGGSSRINENHWGIVLFGLAFLVFGLFMMAVRWFANNDMAQLSATADDVLVVKVEPETRGRRNRTVYRPYFRLTDKDGNEIVAKCMDTYPTNVYPEGTRVTVRYDPSDPQNRAVVEGGGYESETTDFLSLAVAGFGAFWIAVGILVILVRHLIAKARPGGA